MQTPEQSADERIKDHNLPHLNWKRISKAIRDQTRAEVEGRYAEVLERIKPIPKLCGSYSVGRKRLLPIAKALQNPSGMIVCPICLDRTDIESPQCVPELVKKHASFLHSLFPHIVARPVIFLVPAHDYPAARENVAQVIATTDAYARGEGIGTSAALNSVFQDIELREKQWTLFLQGGDHEKRIRHLVEKRISSGLFLRRNPGATEGEAASLTVRTSAQYLALGQSVRDRNWLICNHTTPNLAWYNQIRVAYLHNPVYLY